MRARHGTVWPSQTLPLTSPTSSLSHTVSPNNLLYTVPTSTKTSQAIKRELLSLLTSKTCMNLNAEALTDQVNLTLTMNCGLPSMADTVRTSASWVSRLPTSEESRIVSAIMEKSLRDRSTEALAPAQRWTTSVMLAM
jgi:hypothetical protein